MVLVAGLRDTNRAASEPDQPVSLDVGENFLSYATAWSQGFLEGGMLAFLALFLEARGFTTEAAGTLMAVTMIGVILFQVPVSWLADSCGRIQVLLGCYAVVVLGLVVMPWLTSGIWLAIVLFGFGACTGAMYPLGLSLLGEKTPDQALPRAYAWYLAVECVGSQAGAAAMGNARDHWGEASMFAIGLAAVAMALGAWWIVSVCCRLGNVQRTVEVPRDHATSP
jgi:MFS family permease